MAGRRGAEHASNILEALAEAPRPLSAYELLDRLRPTGVAAPLTVYRALDKLIAAGKVHRVASLNAFVACRAGDHGETGEAVALNPHGAVGFTICDRCGAVEEFTNGTLAEQIGESVARTRFCPRVAAIEVRGLCAKCADMPTE